MSMNMKDTKLQFEQIMAVCRDLFAKKLQNENWPAVPPVFLAAEFIP